MIFFNFQHYNSNGSDFYTLQFEGELGLPVIIDEFISTVFTLMLFEVLANIQAY